MPKITTKTTMNFNDQISSLTRAALGQTSISVDHAVGAIMLQSTEANQKIQEKQKELGGATGQPVGGLEIGDNDGYFRRYQNGIIYIKPPSAPCWVHGAILDKYLSLGADSGFLGYPTTDELTTPDKTGRYNHFQGGSIYFTYETGAQEVHGAIRDKWAALGWEKSWLG